MLFRSGEGTFVQEMTIESLSESFAAIVLRKKNHLLDLLNVRSLLEVEAARLAALHATPQDIQAMEAGITLMEEEIARGQIGVKGDDHFHLAITAASKNQVLLQIMHLIADMLSSSREATLQIPEQPKKTVEDHVEILAAIKKGEELLAAEQMARHQIGRAHV